MGTIYRNGVPFIGTGGGGGTSTDVELTQAEYDALPDTKLTDNITYFITDGNPVTSGVISAEGVVYGSTNVSSALDDLHNGMVTSERTFSNVSVPANSTVWVANIGATTNRYMYTPMTSNSLCFAFIATAGANVQLYVRNFHSEAQTVNVRLVTFYGL